MHERKKFLFFMGTSELFKDIFFITVLLIYDVSHKTADTGSRLYFGFLALVGLGHIKNKRYNTRIHALCTV